MASFASRKYGRSLKGFAGGFSSSAGLTTAMAGNNNDLIVTRTSRGASGNNVRFRIVVSGNNTPLSVSVSGNDVTVNSATSGAGAATSTATQVMNAINSDNQAKKLVQVDLAPGNDGSGTVAAVSFTNLSGGTDWTVG